MRKARSMRSSGGFSLVEVLVASFFLLVVLLGVLPVFTRSMVSNQMAYDNTRAAAFARSEMESYMTAPFDSALMSVPTGQSTLEIEQYYDTTDPLDEKWVTGVPPSTASYEWTRKITIRQFHISAIDNAVLDDGEAQAGDAHSSNVHLKQVLIEVQRGKSSLLGPPRQIVLNTIRSN